MLREVLGERRDAGRASWCRRGGTEGSVHVMVLREARGGGWMAGQGVAGAGALLFEPGLEPLRAELERVFGLNALRVAGELRDERVEGGHVRHACG